MIYGNTRHMQGGTIKFHPAKKQAEELISYGFDDVPDTITAILDRWTTHRATRAELDQTDASHLSAEFHAALEAGDTDTAREYAIRQAVHDSLTLHEDHVSRHEDALARELNNAIHDWLTNGILPNLRATFNSHGEQFTDLTEGIRAPFTLNKILNSPDGAHTYTKLIEHGEAMNRCRAGLTEIENRHGIRFGSDLALYTPAMPSRWHYADAETRAKELAAEEPLKPIAFWLAVLEAPAVGGNPQLAILDHPERQAHAKRMRAIEEKFDTHGAVNVRRAVIQEWNGKETK